MIKAKVISLKGGYPMDQLDFNKLNASIGDEFIVGAFSIGQSCSSVQLNHKGFFNTVFFEFYEDGVLFDPFSDNRFNPYLGIFK
jgi:hypothetical protein